MAQLEIFNKKKVKEKPSQAQPDWAFSERILSCDFSSLRFKENEVMLHITMITKGLLEVLAIYDIQGNLEKVTGLSPYKINLAQKRKKVLTKDKVTVILKTIRDMEVLIREGIVEQDIALIQIILKFMEE